MYLNSQAVRVGPLTDRVVQVAIRIRPAGKPSPQPWDDRTRVEVVGGPQHPPAWLAKLEDHQPPSGTQHAMGLAQRVVGSWDVAQTKRKGRGIETRAAQGQRLSIAADERCRMCGSQQPSRGKHQHARGEVNTNGPPTRP